ncbi:hypothetical protein DL96DRAFT_1821257 [Flagelloscypha sp. PMI_526]|nr:hypothetical protein DL96DRAFT_1821257 [Flagelloscypha sp. PMI_526]
MTPLPLDILGELFQHTDLPTALFCASLSRAVLPFVRRRIYHSIQLTRQNIKSFLSNALHLLRFTRSLQLFTGGGLRFSNRMHSHDIIRLLRSVLEFGVLQSLDYHGPHDRVLIRGLVLRISRMPSLQWLGSELSIKSLGMDHVLDILSTPKLRRLTFNVVDELVIPSAPSGPLPTLTDLSLIEFNSELHSDDLLKRWASSWMNLKEVCQVMMYAGIGTHFPEFPEDNHLKTITLDEFPAPDSFIHFLPHFQHLKHMSVSSVRPNGIMQLVDALQNTVIPFTVTIDFSFHTGHADEWVHIAQQVSSRLQDRHKFLLRVRLVRPTLPDFVARIRDSGLPLDMVPMEFVHVRGGQTFPSWKDICSSADSETPIQ